MRIFAIADLHLPGGDVKPMDVFGPHWERHFERISEDWRARVGEEDVVLLPGDTSWAMQLRDALPDLLRIADLPGRKILLRGNHDYWWSSLSRLRAALPEGFYALQNDALLLSGTLFAGTRGWLCTCDDPQDRKIHEREVQRLALSLQAARRLSADAPIVAMLHYPPFPEPPEQTGFTRLLSEYGVRVAVYGHLHGASTARAFNGLFEGVRYQLVSCDALRFALCEVES